MKLQMSQQQQEEGEISAIDWNDFVVVETIDFPADEMVEAMLPPPASALEVVGNPSAAVGLPKRTEDVMDESSDEEDQGETIRVVPSYTPKVVGASDLSSARVIDPITGKSVAVADMPEHMRIQLLDPKWAEERRKFQEKQKDSNLVSGDAIVANISRLAQSREKVVAASKPAGSAATQAKRPMELPPVTTANPAVAAGTASAPSHLAEPMAKRPRLDMPPAMAAPPPPSAAVPTDSVPEAFEETTLEEEKKLLSEEEFAASLRSPDVTLQIRVPSDSAQMAWNFYGQMVTLSVNVMTTVKDVKAQLSKKHLNDMPANKILLKDPKGGFLSNNATLASLNIGPTATLEMSLKQRGGRK
jgi:splicing factor 3A subunit 1